MFRYRGFCLTIDSELELPALPASESAPDVIVRFGKVPRATPVVTIDEQLAFHSLGGMFRISGGREIVIDPLPEATADILRVLVMGRMMAFLLRQRGWLPLHASAVAIGGRAVLFLGPSGCGKSTTAAAFHARGHDVIADDVAAVRISGEGGAVVLPAGSLIRITKNCLPVPGGLSRMPAGRFQWDKYLFDLTRGMSHPPLQIGKIYILQYGEEARLKAINGPEAVVFLSVNSFAKRRRMDREALAAHLLDCARIAGKAEVHYLFRRESIADLAALVGVVEGDLEDC